MDLERDGLLAVCLAAAAGVVDGPVAAAAAVAAAPAEDGKIKFLSTFLFSQGDLGIG